MSSPAAAVSLVPQAKKLKKKRPGFRPVGKSNSKTSSKNAASKKRAPVEPASKNIHPSSPGAAAAKAPSMAEDDSPQASSPARTALKTMTTRKRKSNGISVGFSIQDDANRQTTEQESSSPSETPELTVAAIPTPTTAALAIPEPSKDKDVLQQLQGEDPDGVRLSSFCTKFKGKKSKLPPGQPRPVRNNNNNDAPTQQQPRHARRDHEPESATGAPIVQIIDGEIVLQESSLEAPGARRSVQQVEEDYDQVVEEDAGLTIVGASYNSFKEGRNKGPQHWTVKETKLFFEALRQLGTDFGSMEAFFDDRTRKQLKRKYRSESVKNPKLIEMALDPKFQKEIDLSVFNVTVDPDRIEAAANEEPPEYEPTDPEPRKEAVTAGDAEEMQDVVEEDAEEERRAGAPQPHQQPQASIWDDYEEPHEEAPAEISGRNMDEFFGIPQDEEPAAAPVSEEAPEEQPAISLVPKNVSKKKKPKFRSAVRKKK